VRDDDNVLERPRHRVEDADQPLIKDDHAVFGIGGDVTAFVPEGGAGRVCGSTAPVNGAAK
jgi:hypothetical protein